MPQPGANNEGDSGVKFACYDKMTCLGFMFLFILVIRPILHFIIILIVLVTFSNTEMPEKDSHFVSSWVHNSTDFTVFEIQRPGRDRGNNPDRGKPQFLPVEQLVRVEQGDTAYLTCRVVNLDTHHTVSWVRSHDVVVLTVGGLVFSSDPRVGVVHLPRPWQQMAVWALRISDVTTRDSGQYQCQVNTEPAITIDITLQVEMDSDALMDDVLNEHENGTKVNNEEEVRSVNIVKVSRKSKEKSDTGFTFSKVPLYENSKVKDEGKTVEGVLSNTLVASQGDKASNDIKIDSKVTNNKSNKEGRSLLLPICLLFGVTSLILVLGSIRTFVAKRKQSDQDKQGKIRSRTNSAESRKSSSSRKSDSSKISTSSRKSKLSQNPDGESMYEEVNEPMARMWPLIEVIEPTPPTAKNYNLVHGATDREESSMCRARNSSTQGFGERYPRVMATVDSLDGSVCSSTGETRSIEVNDRYLTVRKGNNRTHSKEKRRIHFNPFDEYSD